MRSVTRVGPRLERGGHAAWRLRASECGIAEAVLSDQIADEALFAVGLAAQVY